MQVGSSFALIVSKSTWSTVVESLSWPSAIGVHLHDVESSSSTNPFCGVDQDRLTAKPQRQKHCAWHKVGLRYK